MKTINKETLNINTIYTESDSKDILTLDQNSLKNHVNGLVLKTIEQTLNGLLESEEKPARSFTAPVGKVNSYHSAMEPSACRQSGFRQVCPFWAA